MPVRAGQLSQRNVSHEWATQAETGCLNQPKSHVGLIATVGTVRQKLDTGAADGYAEKVCRRSPSKSAYLSFLFARCRNHLISAPATRVA